MNTCNTIALFSSFQRLISNGCVDQNKFREWFEGIITKVINILPIHLNGHELTEINDDSFSNVYIKMRKSGPAFTLLSNIPYETEDIHIDLAPALSFDISVIQEYTTNFQYLQEVFIFITFLLKVLCFVLKVVSLLPVSKQNLVCNSSTIIY